MFDYRSAIRTVIETYDITLGVVGARHRKCVVHCLLGGCKCGGLGEGTMVFEVFFTATW